VIRTLTLIVTAVGLLAADPQHMDLPAGGTLHLKHSVGEVSVVGWDGPGIEISTDAQITPEHQGNELILSTSVNEHRPWMWPFVKKPDVNPRYEIKAPRNARLIIEHDSGGVFIDSMTGDIDVTIHDGQVTLRLPEDAQLSIDAKSKVGAVVSDFAGHDQRKHLFGHAFIGDGSQAPQKLHLRVGYGDIIILKARQPER
jgi:hypothetical protein